MPGARTLLILTVVGALQLARTAAASEAAAAQARGQAEPDREVAQPVQKDSQSTPPPPYPKSAPVVQRNDADAPQPQPGSRPTIKQGVPDALPASTNQPSREERQTYSSHIVVADLASLLLGGVASLVTGSAVPALLGWSIASPVVHGVHGYPERTLASLVVHLAFPALGAAIGLTMDTCSEFPCGFSGIILGGGAGMIAATTLDAAVFARPSAAPSGQPVRAAATSVPSLSRGRDGNCSVGWRGTF